MGLSERKVKQRIGVDPRNLSWSSDTSRFSYKHLTALGWSDEKGIGSDLQGNPNHIAVARKLDNGGIGMGRVVGERQEAGMGAGSGSAGRGFEDVLKRLAAAAAGGGEGEGSASPSHSPAPDAIVGTDAVLPGHRNASRRRHLHAKRLASSNPAALAEILGVPVDSLPASPVPLSDPSTSRPQSPSSARPAPPSEAVTPPDYETYAEPDHGVTTSNLSVADYFKQKMRERMAARQAASSGSATPIENELPSGSLANLPEEKAKKVLSGSAWEGEKTTFAPDQEVGQVFAPSDRTVEEEEDGKAAKRARKEAKRSKKEQKRERGSEPSQEPAPGATASTKSEKEKESPEERAKRKAAKKAKKALKLASTHQNTISIDPSPVVALDKQEKKRKRT